MDRRVAIGPRQSQQSSPIRIIPNYSSSFCWSGFGTLTGIVIVAVTIVVLKTIFIISVIIATTINISVVFYCLLLS